MRYFHFTHFSSFVWSDSHARYGEKYTNTQEYDLAMHAHVHLSHLHSSRRLRSHDWHWTRGNMPTVLFLSAGIDYMHYVARAGLSLDLP